MIKLDILHEDENIVVVNKEAGILSIPDRFNKNIPNYYTILNRKYNPIFTVHRLDKYTSGVLLFAKNESMHKELSQAFMNRIPKKVYWAIVDGILAEKSSEINLPIIESKYKKGTYTVAKKGKQSLTSYSVMKEYERYSLLEVEIHTGRTHQIRVHLAHINHPLIVDPTYGNRSAFLLSELKGKKYLRKTLKEEKPLLERHALHAKSLQIDLPSMGNGFFIDAPLPKDMKAVLYQMEKVFKK